MSFERNVFINCPFDNDYKPLLKALIFTIVHLDFEPQIAITTSSANVRIHQIMRLIRDSKYSIHDISRCAPLRQGELPRFNMPYEMGLDIGCGQYGAGKLRNKQCLVLEKEKNRYDAVISDISGQDIKDHNNEPKELIEKVREWFGAILNTQVPGAVNIWDKYNDCLIAINTIFQNEFTQQEINNFQPAEFIKAVKLTRTLP